MDDLLRDVKICDPAIGSGAFPIGLLQEIYWSRLILSPKADRARLKQEIIQGCLHGVDLDAGAVEIARLRCWLALVVDEDQPRPLPNLDFQIMQGNSLLESFEGEPLHDLAGPVAWGTRRLNTPDHELPLDNDAIPDGELTVRVHTPAQGDVADGQRRYFACHDPVEKARLRDQINADVLSAIEARFTLRREELESSLRQQATFTAGRALSTKEAKVRAAMETELAALTGKRESIGAYLADPRKERPFFLWHFWFREIFESQGGFDIVIANPPYGADLGEETLEVLTKSYEIAGKRPDSFALFIELGVNIIHPLGALCMIVPTGWYSGVSFGGLRRFLATTTNLANIVNLPYDVFEDAWVDTTIFVALKRENRTEWPRREASELNLKVFPKRHKIDSETEFLEGTNTVNFAVWFEDGDSEYLTFATAPMLSVLQKMRQSGSRLGVLADVQRGVTPFELTDEPTHTNSIPALSSTIRRYRYEPESVGYIRYDESLAEFKPYRYFQGHRILLRELISRQLQLQAMLVTEDFVTNKSMQSVIRRAGCPDLRFLLGVLNSHALSWFFLTRSNIANRDDFPKIVLDETRRLPIPAATPADQATLSALVDDILASKRAGDETRVTALEREIDAHVYRLYGLTEAEIALVESTAAARA